MHNRRSHNRTQILVISAFLASLLCCTAYAESGNTDWPRWRGPNGNGISTETDWNPASLTDRPNIVWRASVGYGFSSIAVKDKYLYTMGNPGKKDTVYCLDVTNGEVVWKFSYDCRLGEHPGPRATPTVDDGRVYTLSQEGHLFCLNAKNGKVVWKAHLVKDFGVRSPTWGFAGSPIVDGDLLVLNAGVSGIALDKKTGKKVWVSGPGIGGYAAPVPFNINGKRYAAIFGKTALYGVELETGKGLWFYPWKTSFDVNAADPLIAGNRIFISSNYRSGCAMLEINDNKPHVLWKNDKFNSHFSSFIFINGYIYGNDGAAFSDRGVFRCLEADSGKEMWAANLGFGSLICVDDKLIILNSTGDLIIAEATPEAYMERARAEDMLPRKCWTPPAFANGRLYLRNDKGEILCVDVSK
jgi:outer membrane protein assembly factor BamB